MSGRLWTILECMAGVDVEYGGVSMAARRSSDSGLTVLEQWQAALICTMRERGTVRTIFFLLQPFCISI
ncbi:hypothetical protein A5700_17570 [Mycobacterium sp. E1214]|nr:hypothetical protein A5700_17570 [Mycobacterium sp. E1214]OBH30001.1 hypothetical protein A5693_18565 [Mycobacterium sp. E1319]